MELSKKEIIDLLEVSENTWRKKSKTQQEELINSRGYRLINRFKIGREVYYQIELVSEFLQIKEFLIEKGINKISLSLIEAYKAFKENPNLNMKETAEKISVSLSTIYNYKNTFIEAGLIELEEQPTKSNTGMKNNLNLSKGEYAISEFLKYKEINFLYQVRFSDCRHKNTLPFDFGIFNGDGEVVALIEYDGQQHYMPVESWGGEETLKEVQLRDAIKDDYCKKKGIPLLRIRYDEENTLKVIEEFIAQEQRKVAN